MRTRARFWLATLLAATVWLAVLLAGGLESWFDRDIFQSLYLRGQPEAAQAASVLTQFGGWIILSVAMIVAALILVMRRPQRAAMLLIIVTGGRLLVELQKTLIGRPRPGAPTDHLVVVNSLSFPSAHAANAMITYLAIALLMPMPQRWRGLAVAAAILFALAIGTSRVALGVHWPSDVIGGWSFGLLWTMICMRLASARPEAPPTPAA